jgi:hypothetical protein
MDPAGAVGREFVKMLFGAVAFMREKIIVRISSMVLGHQAIPRHFRHDGGGGDGYTQRIALDDRADWNGTQRQ